MALQDTDLLYLDRGGTLYQVTWQQVRTRTDVLATDEFLIQRGSNIYQVPLGDYWDCSVVSQANDLFLVERNQTLYQHEMIFSCDVRIQVSNATTFSVLASAVPPSTGEQPYIQAPDGTKTFLTATATQYDFTQNGIYFFAGDFTEFEIVGSDGDVDASLSTGDVWNTTFDGVPDFGFRLFRNINNLTGVPNGLELDTLDLTFQNTSPSGDLSTIDVSAATSAIGTFSESDIDPSNAIGGWDVSNVTNMLGMFLNASVFNVDISSWNVSNVTNMARMFEGASVFNADISGWDVANVDAMMSMFKDAGQFNADLGSWDVTGVTNMASTFENAGSFNQDIGDWDVEDVADMDSMFNDANQFDQDLTEWCVRTIPSEPTNFSTGAPLLPANKPNWGTCPVDANGNILLTSGTLSMRGTVAVAAEITDPNGNTTSIGPGNWTYSRNTAGWYTLPMGDMEWLAFNQNTSTVFDFDPGFYTGNLTNMFNMFNNARRFNGDISNWDTSRVTNTTNMFRDAREFDRDIGSWSIGAVTGATNMFFNANAFNQDLSGWNTGNITNFSNFFSAADNFNGNISTWNVASATTFYRMFYAAYAFNNDIGGWNVSNATNMAGMLRNTHAFNQDLSAWDTSNVTNMSRMFSASAINSPIFSNTASVENMGYMFADASNFNQDINSWDVRNVESMIQMFINAQSFNQSLPDWDPNNPALGSTDMSNMFRNAAAMQGDLSNWCIPQVTSKPSGFDTDSGFLNNAAIQPQWGTCPVSGTDVIVNNLNGDKLYAQFEFANNSSQEVIFPDGSVVSVTRSTDLDMDQVGTYQFPMGVVTKLQFGGSTGWVPAATNADFTFEPDFYVGGITNMSRMFYNCRGFNGDISNWDTSAVTCMVSMFDNTQTFNGDISGWNVSGVRNTNGMFDNAFAFNTSISEWNTSSITNMGEMFRNVTAFNQDLSQWDVGNVTNMSRMFQGASAFNQYLNPWDVSAVTNMRNMFNQATDMSGNISNWCVSQFSSKPSGFDAGAAFQDNLTLLPDWGTCSTFNGIYLRELVGGTGDFVIGGVAADNTVQIRQPDGTITNPSTGSFANKYTQLGWYEIENMESLTGLRFFDNDILFDDTSETAKFYFSETFDTSNLNEFRQMFREASVFDGDLSMFDTSNATNMAAMFRNNAAFDGDISHFNTENVTNMSNMFRGATSFTGDISDWSVFSVTDMDNMFRNAAAFGVNLSDWCVPNVGTTPDNFDTDSGFEGDTAIQPGWGGCPDDFTIDTEVVIGTPTNADPVLYDTEISITTAATTTPANVPVLSSQWQRSTDSGTTWTDIGGATGLTYTVGADDRNSQIRLVQVLKNDNSPYRTTTSNVLTVEDTVPPPQSGGTPIDISDIDTDSEGYHGVILHQPTNRFWLTPFRSEYVVGIDLDDFTDKVSYNVPDMIGSDDYKFGGSTILPDNRILYAPYYGGQFAIFDPEATTEADRWTLFATPSGTFKFAGALVASVNDTPYAFPYRAGGIWQIDYVNGTATEVYDTGSNQYGPATEGPDQRIYLAPGTNNIMGIYDPSDNSFSTMTVPRIGGSSSYPQNNGGISVASNNSVYMGAAGQDAALKLNFNNLDANGNPTVTAIDMSSARNGSTDTDERQGKPQLLGDGKIFFPPIGSRVDIVILDPSDDSIVTYPNDHESGRSIGGNQLPDGKIISAPYTSDNHIQWWDTFQAPGFDVFSPRTNYQQ